MSIKRPTSSARQPGGNPRPVHYVLSTHWDREWYQIFQDYRRRLVVLMDRVLDDMASGKLKGPFVTDGQSIVLEDYVEIRPERRRQVERFAKSGKLKAGPWYVMPDEWLVSGESLVRNLRLGREVARGSATRNPCRPACPPCAYPAVTGLVPQAGRRVWVQSRW